MRTTLIIHPKDSSTDFLKPIYQSIENRTIITGGISKSDLKEQIKFHDRIISLGHGTGEGLMSVGEFYTTDFYIIDGSLSQILSNKEDNLYIWCNADQYVQRHGLVGFYSGMFISEMDEALYFGFDGVNQDTIDESNNTFSRIVEKYIDEPIEVLFYYLIDEYGSLAERNPIARFNLQRLHISISKSFVGLENLIELNN
jgi:hypothetical protein